MKKTLHASRRSVLKGGFGAVIAAGFATTVSTTTAEAATPRVAPHHEVIDMTEWTQRLEKNRIKTLRTKHS